ncbi:response regulator transcription factor [Lampropedia aestuarii]|uniref:Response regulator transcription factor n=1 Tax=Lampropedia aestuarii TaxID=2562762 RepID=A0A4V3YXC3_9BURK|nr:response regulator transcription factor [Lampropedia aestuarii]MDH5857941.1 response regulator transcription factor [Lampropedia aestuarii]THJ34532.1 response regulator transcription factor [Lampropedia aestuarii]
MIKVGIVDDHAIVRTGLKEFFSHHVDLQVVAEGANGKEAIDIVRQHALDVLIMDVSMPELSGLDALPLVKAKAPDLGVLIFSTHPQEHYAVNLIRQGASGYINKDSDPEEIVKAVRMIAMGKRYISLEVADLLAQQLSKDTSAAPHEQLSEREFQVFIRLAQGQSPSDIADELALSIKTVSTYRTRLLEKLALSTNSDLTYYALKNGLIN